MSAIDRYTCEEVMRRLEFYVDRELSPREMQLAREHIETCVACAREHAFVAAMLSTLKAKLRRIDMPPEFLDRIVLKLAEVRAPSETDPS